MSPQTLVTESGLELVSEEGSPGNKEDAHFRCPSPQPCSSAGREARPHGANEVHTLPAASSLWRANGQTGTHLGC